MHEWLIRQLGFRLHVFVNERATLEFDSQTVSFKSEKKKFESIKDVNVLLKVNVVDLARI